MPIGARLGCLVLVAALASSALAQEGGAGSSTGTWQDPPARGAAAGRPPETGKPAQTPEPQAAREAADAPAKADRRTVRRERAERRRSVATVEPRRSRIAAAPQRRYATRRFEVPQHEEVLIETREEAHAFAPPARRRVRVAPARYPLAGFRREGWGALLRGSREARIADAQARGFIVLRAQTLRGPDSHLTRRFTDYDSDEE